MRRFFAADVGFAGVGHNGRPLGRSARSRHGAAEGGADFERKKGADQNRTGVRGFAGLCLTTRPRRQAAGGMVSRPSGSTPTMTQQSLLDGNETAAPLVPPKPTLPKLREAAAGCEACDLWKTGTQTVYGEGLRRAEIVFVGEQPGDKEDLAGRPFV